jgi:hypothetical protein
VATGQLNSVAYPTLAGSSHPYLVKPGFAAGVEDLAVEAEGDIIPGLG